MLAISDRAFKVASNLKYTGSMHIKTHNSHTPLTHYNSDVLIIGAGAAGASAAIFTARANLSTLALTSNVYMSQLMYDIVFAIYNQRWAGSWKIKILIML